jgi:heme a synthase
MTPNKKYIFYWLIISCISVLVMVAVGGLTRLTDSGLSITEWKPITGTIPPLSESDWNIEFNKYKISPEYIHIHTNIDMNHFKKIYFLEYFHRLLGRIVGIIFFFPAIYFLAKGYFSSRNKKVILLASILGICQGFMGWYMVKSGLKDIPYVSHFRLTMHLLFALSIFLILLNEALHIYFLRKNKTKFENKISFLLGLIIFQIALGGLVAGLDAGLIYNEFPLMGENIWPSELITTEPLEYLSSNAIVQFLHRIMAVIVVFYSYYIAFILLNKKYYKSSILLTSSVTIQFLLGLYTLLYSVPIHLGLIHQIFAFVLCGLTLIILWITAKNI